MEVGLRTLCDFILPKFYSCDLIVIGCVPAHKGCHISQQIWYQLKAGANTIPLIHEWRKSNTQYEVIVKNATPYPKSIIAVDSRCLFITDRNFLFYHCTLARNTLLDTPEYSSLTSNDQPLGTFFFIKWSMVLRLNNGFTYGFTVVGYLCQFYDTEYVTKMTITCTCRHWLQHVIRQIACSFIGLLSM